MFLLNLNKPAYRLCNLLLVLFCTANLEAAPKDTIFINKSGSYDLENNTWSFFQTDKKNTAIEDIVQLSEKNNFKPTGVAVFNGGIPSQYYWFHLTLENKDDAENDLVIDIESPRINELELFERSSGKVYSLGRTGDFFPFQQRIIQYKNFLFRTHLNKGEYKDYFLYVNQIGHTFILPIKIYKRSHFQNLSFKNYFLDGLTYGILLFVSILSLLFFFNTRYRLYLLYSFYLITGILWFLSYFGLGYQYIWSNFPVISTVSAPFLACMNLILNIRISQIILELKNVSHYLYRLSNIAIGLLFTAGWFPVFINLNIAGYELNHTYLILFLLVAIFSILVVFLSILLYSIKGSVAARYYFASSIIKVGGIFNLALMELGITPGFYKLEGMLQTGIVIEITLLTYAIAKRYALYKQKTLLQVVHAQEEERQRISKEIHDNISNSLSALKYAFINLSEAGSKAAQNLEGKLNNIAVEISRLENEARNISHYMMPDYIKHYPLPTIIEMYIKNVSEKTGSFMKESTLVISFRTNEQAHKFSDFVNLNIFRIIQELITNILKHSRASSAAITFEFDKKGLVIISDDNGIGFLKKGTDEIGLGVTNIKSRVKIVSGTIRIQSPSLVQAKFFPAFSAQGDPGTDLPIGTLITIKIPYRNNNREKQKSHDY